MEIVLALLMGLFTIVGSVLVRLLIGEIANQRSPRRRVPAPARVVSKNPPLPMKPPSQPPLPRKPPSQRLRTISPPAAASTKPPLQGKPLQTALAQSRKDYIGKSEQWHQEQVAARSQEPEVRSQEPEVRSQELPTPLPTPSPTTPPPPNPIAPPPPASAPLPLRSSAPSPAPKIDRNRMAAEEKLLGMLQRDRKKAERLLTAARQSYPGAVDLWILEKVIRDLERDRR